MLDSKIKILLVDDSEVVRLGLRSLLSMYPKMEVVGEASNFHDSIKLTVEKNLM